MSEIFISKELREARNNIRRTNEEIIQLSNELKEIIESDIKKAQINKGRDYITYTPDRKIGKSYTLIQAAIKYGLPLIVHDSLWAKHIKREIKKEYGVDITIMSYRNVGINLDGIYCEIILKDELVPIENLRDILNCTGKRYVSVVGIN